MSTSALPTGPSDNLDPAVGQSIGPYKLLERIGEGGYGVVYVADQQKPVRRRVALKVIKLGMDTKQVVARFEAERQALAMMDHPNIAKVLDAGATDAGRPYFVMELVRGIRITEYCDQNKLPTTERLDLFIQVCHAVQHAHQKGIVHRDLKPSNILVTLHDGVPVPKVIDFGIAKATEGRLTDVTLYTQLHQFVGTPAYMSPEQAEMSGLDVDTRSDIYSLGVMLYELLTGMTPFDGKELMSLGVDAMRRTIREQEPQNPSTRLGTLKGEELTTTARRRSVEAPQLLHSIRGDLDWIAMKCLEKDRTRRYATANALAADVRRHLGNEPIVARPPSTLYRFQKLYRRNKLAFGVGIAVAVVLILGTVVSTWQAVRAMKAQAEAVAAAKREKVLKQKAKATEDLIRGRDLFVKGDYEGADALVSNLPPEVIENEFVTAGPLFRGLAHWHAGGQRWRRAADYFDLLISGPARKYEALCRDAPEPIGFDPLSLEPFPYEFLYVRQALVLLELGDREGYERVRMAAVEKYADSYMDRAGALMLLTCELLPAQVSDRVKLCKAAAAGQFTRNERYPANAGIVALFEYRRGRPGQALKWARYFLDRDPGPGQEAEARVLIAMANWQLGHREKASQELAYCREQIDGAFRGGPGIGSHLNGLWAEWLIARRLLREADKLFESDSLPSSLTGGRTPANTPSWDEAVDRALEEIVQDFEDNGDAQRLTSFSWFLKDSGIDRFFERLFRKSLNLQRNAYGSNSTQAANAMVDLSIGLGICGKIEECGQWAREALVILKREHGPVHATVARTLDVVAWAFWSQGNLDQAEAAWREALSIQGELRRAKQPEAGWEFFMRFDLGDVYYSQGHFSEMEEMLRGAIALRPGTEEGMSPSGLLLENGEGFVDSTLTGPVYKMANALVAQGKLAEAEAVYRQELLRRENLPKVRAGNDAPDPQGIRLRFSLSQLQLMQGKETDTKGLLDDAIHQADPFVLTSMAWSLATSAEAARRDGTAAVRLADKAVEVTGRTNATPAGLRQARARDGDFPLETLAAAYAEAGDFAKAVSVQQEAITVLAPYMQVRKEEFERRLRIYESGKPYHDVHALEATARVLLAEGHFDEAEPSASECYELHKTMTPDQWPAYSAMSLLGAVKLGQGNYDDAKPLLLDSYAGLKQKESSLPAYARTRLREAAEHVVELYETTNQPDEATKWRQTLSELTAR